MAKYAVVRISPIAAGLPDMLISQANMTTDDAPYGAKYLEADGTVGDAISVRRPNGVGVRDNDSGFLGKDSSDQNIFIPCHARMDPDIGLVMETRTGDPVGPVVGRIWLRTDL